MRTTLNILSGVCLVVGVFATWAVAVWVERHNEWDWGYGFANFLLVVVPMVFVFAAVTLHNLAAVCSCQ